MVRTAPQSTDKLRGRAGLRREGGQALVMVVLFLFVLLGMAAMVIDVGYAFYAQRSLQAQVDAAALAGAQELPDPSRAEAIAYEYSGQSGGKSERGNVRDVTVEVRTRCLTKIPGCDPVNAVVVEERATVKTLFAGVLGIDTAALGERRIVSSLESELAPSFSPDGEWIAFEHLRRNAFRPAWSPDRNASRTRTPGARPTTTMCGSCDGTAAGPRV